MKRPTLGVLVCLLLTTGCAESLRGPLVKTGPESYTVIPPEDAGTPALDYVIRPLDTIDITVFNEPDISSKNVPVDASGDVALPLIGSVQASGLTAADLAASLRGKYRRYYLNPQVTVVVSTAASQRINVQGQVRNPGLYDVRGATTLLDAIALASGETENAALREVLIIRTVQGERMAALFDLNRIRRNEDPDPQVLAKDVIVVGHSNVKQVWHDVLRAAPLLNVYTAIK